MNPGGESPVIETIGLTKCYGPVTALRGLTLEVRRGEVFGLLGPNGSGKTTTIRLLLGLLRPTAGEARVAGHDCWRSSLEVRQLVSYLPGELRLYGSMRAIDLLKFLCRLRDADALDRAVSIAVRVMKLDLSRKVRTYSTGMKLKLALSQVFADPADILILDEPTAALDPSARADVLGMVTAARKQGQTVIFSGHVLSEVEQVADRVAIMRLGRLKHIEDMRERRSLRMLLIKFTGDPPASVPEEQGLTIRERNGDTLLLEHRGALLPLLGWLAREPVADVAIGTEDLRSLYDRYHGPNAQGEEADSPSA